MEFKYFTQIIKKTLAWFDQQPMKMKKKFDYLSINLFPTQIRFKEISQLY